MKKGKEVYKYDKIYSREGTMRKNGIFFTWEEANDKFKKVWRTYGHSVEGRGYIQYIIKLQPRNVIDIGCGGNELCQILKKEGISECIGVDCSCPDADIIASAHDIPVEDKSYDLLLSFDCMEHIPKEEVLDSFKEFARISNRMLVKVCLVRTGTRIDGEALHTCLETSDWWLTQANIYFKNIKSELIHPKEFVDPPSFARKSYRHVIIYGESK